ncbi:hypothetical protein [Geodermatophilus sp. SYSU D01186]
MTRVSTIQGEVHVPVLTRTATIAGLFALLACAGVAGAAPALAVDDPTRPDARVTHGPSCRPGGVVLEVTGGAVAYTVTLTTTRAPAGEDVAEVQPGQVVVLGTGDVDWGETIDPGLEYAALDGSGTHYVDDLEGYSFTRPAAEDCAAIAPPTAAATVPAPAVDAGSPALPGTELPDAGTAPGPGGAAPDEPGPADPGPADALDVLPAVTASAREVVAGEEVTVHGQGFAPGEQVAVRVADGDVLTAVTAGADGALDADVRIPAATATGAAVLELVGADSSSTATVGLRVAAAPTPLPRPDGGVALPVVVAGIALLGAGAGLAAVTTRRARRAADPTSPGSA